MTEKRKPLFERLKRGLKEGIAHSQSELTLRTVEVPEEPPEIDAPTLVLLRGQARMSQSVFARMLNVSTKTLQSWEQGVRRPSDASRRLIQVFSAHPDIVCEAAGLPSIKLEGVVVQQDASGRRKILVQQRTAGSRKPVDSK